MDLAPLALIGILALWGLLGFLAWTAATVLSRRPHTLIALPLCVIAGIAGGALVPALGRKDGLGLGLSLLVALVGAVLTAATSLSLLARTRGGPQNR
jgi:hypothetical protein